ncbi:SH3 domain-containing protein [Flavobacteriaceae bacterium MAR_2009_75]|nr:SH3 domain-containing protein [Flavobacteriaceae bacterium MAR_2009_75]
MSNERVKIFFNIVRVLAIFVLLITCKQVRKATDLITKPSARELYARNHENDSVRFPLWKKSFESSLKDSLSIDLPYSETGTYFDELYRTYSYNIELHKGRTFFVEIQTDTVGKKVFIDLYKISKDSLGTLELLESNNENRKSIEYQVEDSGIYKLTIQPEIEKTSSFSMRLYTRPVFRFPVAGKDNQAIQSFWGAARDRGRRTHEGLDIFADRGTPIIAATDGRVSSTGNRGLGGKQVWQRTGIFGYSLYYAHLDSILVNSGEKVETGDTLGLVGNTGNARTTKPHLHFGIYQGYRGAIDPLPFVRISEVPQFEPYKDRIETPVISISGSRANLRNRPSLGGAKIGEAIKNDTLALLGLTDKWAHVQNQEGMKAFVHLSLVDITNAKIQ